jgi:hypothetical protein
MERIFPSFYANELTEIRIEEIWHTVAVLNGVLQMALDDAVVERVAA